MKERTFQGRAVGDRNGGRPNDVADAQSRGKMTLGPEWSKWARVQ